MGTENNEKLRKTIDDIESGYEFMLAYAAQGRDFEYTGGGAGPSVRQFLNGLRDGLKTIADDLESEVKNKVDSDGHFYTNFIDVLRKDAENSKAAVEMVLSLPSIGSQVIDNLNASIHLRALLTDVFLIDEALNSLSKKPQ